MKNKPVLDGKITDDKVFFENLLEDWENAEVLYKNWDKISEEFRKNEGAFQMLIYRTISFPL